MADKPKTYPQQIQELKAQLIEAQEQNSKYQEQIALIPDLQKEVEFLRDALDKASSIDYGTTVNHKSQLTDLQQVADSNATLARNQQARADNLQQTVNQLESQLELLGKEQDKNQQLNKKLELVSEELKTANLRVATLNQRSKDAIQERDNIVERQSRELQLLRMDNRSKTRILNEVQDALQNAPDIISSLKYIVGINGPSN